MDRGLNSTESIDYVYDLNVAHGGPLIRDKFWFFGSARRFSINVPVTDSYYKNEDGTAPRYMAASKYPGGTGGLRPGINDDRITSGLLRLTYQITQNNKFSRTSIGSSSNASTTTTRAPTSRPRRATTARPSTTSGRRNGRRR